jgi:hypothetical protein
MAPNVRGFKNKFVPVKVYIVEEWFKTIIV